MAMAGLRRDDKFQLETLDTNRWWKLVKVRFLASSFNMVIDMRMSKEEQRKFYNSMAWRNKRDEVLAKHNYECLWCKEQGKVTTEENAILEVDHIYELEHYPKLALVDENLRVLCRSCHNKRHERFEHAPKKRNKWEDERW